MTDPIHELLRKIRVLRGYSQEYVAEQTGISVSTYARIESAKVEMDFSTLMRLAALYKMSIDEMIHFGDQNFRVNETQPEYLKLPKISVIVELDGLDTTLDYWIKKLTAINKAI